MGCYAIVRLVSMLLSSVSKRSMRDEEDMVVTAEVRCLHQLLSRQDRLPTYFFYHRTADVASCPMSRAFSHPVSCSTDNGF
jgi:hypothetical protein